MAQYGLAPFGVGAGPFGGPGLISILGILVARANQIIVVWDAEPLSTTTARFDSASSFENYSIGVADPFITASDGTKILPKGNAVATRTPIVLNARRSPDTNLQSVIDLDSSMERGVDYDLTVLDRIRGVNKEAYSGPTVFTFDGVEGRRVVDPITIIKSKDFATHSATQEDGASGFVFDPNNDVGTDEGDRFLIKRVFRRILSGRGSFTHLPNYGLGFQVKGLFKPSVLQSMASEAQAQLRQEPDILNAGVSLQPVATTRGLLVRATISLQRVGQEPATHFYQFAPQNQIPL